MFRQLKVSIEGWNSITGQGADARGLLARRRSLHLFANFDLEWEASEQGRS
jgi:hypothetical protein